MLYVSVDHLQPGMILGRDLPSETFCLSLVTLGQELTTKHIDRIKELGIPGAYIEVDLCGDIAVDDIINPTLKQKLLTGIKKQFDDYTGHTVVSNSSVAAFAQMSSELVSTVLSKEEVMLNMINIRSYDGYTYSHSMLVGLISVLIGTKLGLRETSLNDLAMCGLMHDIGKLDVPIEITNKPARLTAEEFAQMRKHPDYAVQRLRGNRLFPYMVLKGIESHHEKYDGSGYPKGLKGEDIPLYGRILALADVFDAITSKRSYREAWTAGQAIDYMMTLANTHFDINLLNVFLSVIAAYPVGTIIRLSNGYIGVVIKNTSGMTLRPTIRVMTPERYQGTEIDLASDMAYLSVTVEETVSDVSVFTLKAPVESK